MLRYGLCLLGQRVYTMILTFPCCFSFSMIDEMNFAHLRMLNGMSVENGMSMPDMGMSMPDMGMSMPDMGMSMDYGSSTDEEDAPCVPANLATSPSELVSLTLEVETTGATFDASSLSQTIVSAVTSELSVCVPESPVRRLNIRSLVEQDVVVGVHVNDETGENAGGTLLASCIAR